MAIRPEAKIIPPMKLGPSNFLPLCDGAGVGTTVVLSVVVETVGFVGIVVAFVGLGVVVVGDVTVVVECVVGTSVVFVVVVDADVVVGIVGGGVGGAGGAVVVGLSGSGVGEFGSLAGNVLAVGTSMRFLLFIMIAELSGSGCVPVKQKQIQSLFCLRIFFLPHLPITPLMEAIKNKYNTLNFIVKYYVYFLNVKYVLT